MQEPAPYVRLSPGWATVLVVLLIHFAMSMYQAGRIRAEVESLHEQVVRLTTELHELQRTGR